MRSLRLVALLLLASARAQAEEDLADEAAIAEELAFGATGTCAIDVSKH